ncbi:cupin domain-containing protein [Actinomadura litoris]|uniref:cupin domain-containing protein n=1 Tax=Actinomadura litoris TaxID=2678616 RepID=UPI001FA71B9F|nr:cupin domain-containing protein [Actinomadura litoris]
MMTKPLHLDDVTPVRWGGQEAARFLLRGTDTAGRFSLYEVSLPANEGSIVHTHEHMDETFFVVEGRITVRLGDEEFDLRAGTVLFCPRAIPHAFRNSGTGTAKILCVTTPGGIEDFFEELSALMAGATPPEWPRMREVAARHGIVAHPPATSSSGERT